MKTAGVGAAVAALALPAGAQDWDVRITPYVWLPAYETDVTFDRDEEAETSASLFDLLDGAFLVFGEAARGPVSFVGEVNWLRLRDEIDTPGPLISGDLVLSGTMSAFSAGYALRDTGRTRIEALAGLRYWDVTAKAELSRISLPEVSVQLLDPIVGVRARHAAADRWELAGSAGVGGGNDSDGQIDLIASASYAFTSVTHAQIGYRYYEIDVGEGAPFEGLRLFGPFGALQFRF